MSFFLGHRRTNRPLWRRLPRMVGFLLRLLVHQRGLLFQPTRKRLASPAEVGLDFEEVSLPGRRGRTVRGWWIPGPAGTADGKAFLFLPGAVANLSHEVATLRYLRRLGAAVLAVDYPGFGASEGRPSIAGCHAAAAAAFHFLGRRGFAPGDLVLYGRSLGSAFATELAAREPVAGLIFQSCFNSAREFGELEFPRWAARLLCYTPVEPEGRIGDCRCPILFLHSEADEVIPFELGFKVYLRASDPRCLVRLSGSHFSNDWHADPRVRCRLEELLSGAARGWRGVEPERAA